MSTAQSQMVIFSRLRPQLPPLLCGSWGTASKICLNPLTQYRLSEAELCWEVSLPCSIRSDHHNEAMFCSAHIREILIYIFNMLCECQAAAVVKSRSVDFFIETTCILTHDGLIFYHCKQTPGVVQHIILILSNALKHSTHTHMCSGLIKDIHTMVCLSTFSILHKRTTE